MIIALQIIFFLLFILELRFLHFKRKKDRYIWMGIVLLFGCLGYSLFIVFRRKLLLKRKFNPKFNSL